MSFSIASTIAAAFSPEAASSDGHHKLISDSGVALVHGVPFVTSTTR
jgi:hypothetical protein